MDIFSLDSYDDNFGLGFLGKGGLKKAVKKATKAVAAPVKKIVPAPIRKAVNVVAAVSLVKPPTPSKLKQVITKNKTGLQKLGKKVAAAAAKNADVIAAAAITVGSGGTATPAAAALLAAKKTALAVAKKKVLTAVQKKAQSTAAKKRVKDLKANGAPPEEVQQAQQEADQTETSFVQEKKSLTPRAHGGGSPRPAAAADDGSDADAGPGPGPSGGSFLKNPVVLLSGLGLLTGTLLLMRGGRRAA